MKKAIIVLFVIVVLMFLLLILYKANEVSAPVKDNGTSNPNVCPFGTSTAVHFSPNGGCCNAIASEIEKASRDIAVCTYYFTEDRLSDSLIKAKHRGIAIRIVLDKSQTSSKYSETNKFGKEGIEARIDSTHHIMHNKYCIIDSSTVITGSYNWTDSAEKENAENLIIIKGSPELAAKYLADFEKHWEHSTECNTAELIPAAEGAVRIQPQKEEKKER